ncbi:hypothetical protein CEXT_212491 [Caerostris extrusa]|uniref:Uncharacterized protein n=1 Tax=Caerostris extrusa TaxID=172846 RepID=A0AAV4R1P7_CAEEX|nr:hypothetical protein CEXT_212491 [Caerostris extrusa]
MLWISALHPQERNTRIPSKKSHHHLPVDLENSNHAQVPMQDTLSQQPPSLLGFLDEALYTYNQCREP